MKHRMIGSQCTHSPLNSAKIQRSATQRSIIWFSLLAFVLTCAFAPHVYGQATGSFSGNVLDKSGSGVAAATVTVTSAGTGLSRTVNTDSAGHFLVPLLPVATFTIRVDATGFQSVETKDLH